MKITSMKFKVTTSKWKCHYCKKTLKGEEGFVHIICEPDKGYYWQGFNNIRICWDCLTELWKECKEDRKDRKSKYIELTKKAILRNLEK